MRITIDPVKYKAYLHSRMLGEIEANEELLNLFRRDIMDSGAEGAQVPQKAFESITKTLTKCKEIASTLNVRSRKLVSAYTGMSKPTTKDKEEKQKVDSVVLIHVLRDIEEELCRSLSEISDNLEKLEKAW